MKADSSLKCNTGDGVEFNVSEDLGGRSESKDLARAIVETLLDSSELSLSDFG